MGSIKNSPEISITVKNVSKVYPGTMALNNVDFNVYKGRVNVLIGENGAGKSTLMKILAGVEQKTSGDIYFEGNEINVKNTREAAKLGIHIIHQELNMFPELSVMQNIFMATEQTKFNMVLDNEFHYKKALNLMEILEHSIDPHTRLGDLKVGEQQIVEIAKTIIHQNLKVLIMDEPTSSLSASEVEVLFKLINDLKNLGVAIVYISHRLEEIMEVGDHITILRDGKFVAEEEVKNIDIPWIVRNMVGRESNLSIDKSNIIIGENILEVKNMTLPKAEGGFIVDNASFNLKKGEILGLYGLMGAGRTEMVECIMGLHPESNGRIFLDGNEVKAKSNVDQIKNGFGHIPEDRQKEGLIQTLSVGKNITLSSLGDLSKYGKINEKEEKSKITEMIKRLYIKVADTDLLISSLSGGNQQKCVIGKWILTKPKVLFMDEPTRGIDVGAKADVFKIMGQLAEEGIGIVYVGSDLKEILAVSDRVLVMSNGKITGEFVGEEITEEKLVIASAAGHDRKNYKHS